MKIKVYISALIMIGNEEVEAEYAQEMNFESRDEFREKLVAIGEKALVTMDLARE